MSSIVLELQHDALSKDVALADLLRKALVVARKLKVGEFQTWLEDELKGYGEAKSVPAYRKIKGTLKVVNPFMGLQPLYFKDTEMGERLSLRGVGMSVAALESTIKNSDANGVLTMPFSQGVEQALMKGMDCDLQPIFVLDYSQLIGILDSIRNIVLNWSLKLEEEGILGEGLTFSQKEKDAASKSGVTNIQNFFQNVSNAQIQQDSPGASQNFQTNEFSLKQVESFLSSLAELSAQIELSRESDNELKADVSTIKAQIESPKPKEGIIKQSLQSIKSIIEKAGGTAVGQILIELGKMGL